MESVIENVKVIELFPRKCDCCNKGMKAGFLIEAAEYFCSDSCLNSQYTTEEIEALCIGDDGGESYYTEWEELDEEVNYTLEGIEVLNN